MEKMNTSGASSKRAAPWSPDEWLDWLGFSVTLMAGVGGFLACWLFGA